MFARAIIAALLELLLVLWPLTPLVASSDDSCSQMPCCRGEHAACKRSAHTGVAWSAIPECARGCGQAPGIAGAAFSLLVDDGGSGSPGGVVSHVARFSRTAPVAVRRDAILYQRPPPQDLL